MANPALARAGVAAGLTPQEATAFANISSLLVASTATGALGGRQRGRRWVPCRSAAGYLPHGPPLGCHMLLLDRAGPDSPSWSLLLPLQ